MRDSLGDLGRNTSRAAARYRRTRSNVYGFWHALCDRAGVRRCRPHDLRHTAASVLLLQGIDMRTVMEILGHSRMATTSDLYTHVPAEVKADAASRMDAFLRGLSRED